MVVWGRRQGRDVAARPIEEAPVAGPVDVHREAPGGAVAEVLTGEGGQAQGVGGGGVESGKEPVAVAVVPRTRSLRHAFLVALVGLQGLPRMPIHSDRNRGKIHVVPLAILEPLAGIPPLLVGIQGIVRRVVRRRQVPIPGGAPHGVVSSEGVVRGVGVLVVGLGGGAADDVGHGGELEPVGVGGGVGREGDGGGRGGGAAVPGAIKDHNAIRGDAGGGGQVMVIEVGHLQRPQLARGHDVVHPGPHPPGHRQVTHLNAEVRDGGAGGSDVHAICRPPQLHRGAALGAPLELGGGGELLEIDGVGGESGVRSGGGNLPTSHNVRALSNIHSSYPNRCGQLHHNHQPSDRCHGHLCSRGKQLDGGVGRVVGGGEVGRCGQGLKDPGGIQITNRRDSKSFDLLVTRVDLDLLQIHTGRHRGLRHPQPQVLDCRRLLRLRAGRRRHLAHKHALGGARAGLYAATAGVAQGLAAGGVGGAAVAGGGRGGLEVEPGPLLADGGVILARLPTHIQGQAQGIRRQLPTQLLIAFTETAGASAASGAF
mmetsp:Transcript_57326/g.125569  ORF Transcript_57326/g.125569 Transcript_57326/m.125569 type:complete len:540 (+) Transcript_57326:831-2450(+)